MINIFSDVGNKNSYNLLLPCLVLTYTHTRTHVSVCKYYYLYIIIAYIFRDNDLFSKHKRNIEVAVCRCSRWHCARGQWSAFYRKNVLR